MFTILAEISAHPGEIAETTPLATVAMSLLDDFHSTLFLSSSRTSSLSANVEFVPSVILLGCTKISLGVSIRMFEIIPCTLLFDHPNCNAIFLCMFFPKAFLGAIQ